MIDNGAALGRAFASERNAQDWKAYAKKLEQQLLVAQANLAGHKALKEIAIRELTKVAPSHFLTVQQNRQRLFDEQFDAVVFGDRRTA
ncbi:hypothetical protein [Paraburkholderia sp. SOS3]|uniref:hypothetical protein n=1 Tax=Paraburkholderia sp. SOS3 TaxID=1926494 RepID=UPI000947547D|nr:hypothetical protein [Paraburkholderia sp. SOS3]APR34322.1 hypothetical protein BTO02_01650 [Paraburkholderia sp. SOS3]